MKGFTLHIVKAMKVILHFPQDTHCLKLYKMSHSIFAILAGNTILGSLYSPAAFLQGLSLLSCLIRALVRG